MLTPALTQVLAWLATLALCVAAVLFGQTARSGRRRRGSARGRTGVFVSRSGPLLAVFVAAGAGAVSGAWLAAAVAGACGVVLAAVLGLLLAPR